MKTLITSGGTCEYIDSVRLMTNVSSGLLGATIANVFERNLFRDSGQFLDQDLTYIHGKKAAMPWRGKCIEAISAQAMYDMLRNLAPRADVIIHCAAISDFTFVRNSETKLKSSSKEDFIAYMAQTIDYTPKILPMLKQWNPTAYVVSFKFEVGLTTEQLLDIGAMAIRNGYSDLVVANDKLEMQREQEHVAHIIDTAYASTTVRSKCAIANEIYRRAWTAKGLRA